MTTTEIDQIPQQVAEHLIDENTAIWKLLSEFYVCPQRFLGRRIYDEDIISDFVTSNYERTRKIILHYNPKICPFSAYFTNSIYAAFHTMEQKKAIQMLEKSIMESSYKDIYEEKCMNYAKNEYSEKFYAADKTDEDYCIEDSTAIEYQKLSKRRPYIVKSYDLKRDEFRWIEKTYEQRNIIINALKHSYYLKESIVSNVSKFCDYDVDFLYEKINILNSTLKRKIEKRQEFIQRRDNAYFFHKRCSLEMKKLIPFSYLHKAIKQKYNKHTLSWISKNKLLEKNKLKICPSNKTIAEIIGISERQVCYHLAAVRQSLNKQEKEKESKA